MAKQQANSLLPGCKHIRRASHNWKRLKIGESPFAAAPVVEDDEGPIVEDNDDDEGQVEERQDQQEVGEEPTMVEEPEEREEPEEVEATAAPAEVPLRRSARVRAREQALVDAAPRRSQRIARLREQGRLPVSYRE